MAIGSVIGALLAARRAEPHIKLLLGGAAVFGVGFTLAVLAPNYWLFGLCLVIIGLAAQTFTTSTSGLAQLSTEPAMRGRVMAIVLAIALGGTPDRRADRRLGGRCAGPALGALYRRGRGLRRGAGRHPLYAGNIGGQRAG